MIYAFSLRGTDANASVMYLYWGRAFILFIEDFS